jgi:hypothetical protein
VIWDGWKLFVRHEAILRAEYNAARCRFVR